MRKLVKRETLVMRSLNKHAFNSIGVTIKSNVFKIKHQTQGLSVKNLAEQKYFQEYIWHHS